MEGVGQNEEVPEGPFTHILPVDKDTENRESIRDNSKDLSRPALQQATAALPTVV